MTRDDKILNTLALTFIDGLGPLRQRVLMDNLGSANELWALPLSEVAKIGGNIGERLADQSVRDNAFRRAEQEMKFIDQHNINVILYGDGSYSVKLMQCPDSPIVLYQLGNQSLNNRRMVAMVGTRNASAYGRDTAAHIVAELAKLDSSIVIVSGLAYGIDIASHRAALEYGLDTIAVVAHGLDRVYPQMHRKEAAEIVTGHGALLTEFPTLTQPIGANFLQRNRIVAGLCDATIVIESAEKGGSMSTARLTVEYNRELFSVPARLNDKNSAGCNKLISEHKAEIFVSAEDFMKKMNWELKTEPELPFAEESVQLNGLQGKIAALLRNYGAMQVNEITERVDESFTEVSATLGEMLFSDIVQQLPGDMYDLTFDFKMK